MYFKTAFIFSLAASAIALPTTHEALEKRAGVLKAMPYAKFQISDGKAGNALAEVQKNFPINEKDLKNVDANDLVIIQAARKTAENAETGPGGFNDALKNVTGAEADAIQAGKIKNKVLKLKLEVLALQIDSAQNPSLNNSAKLSEEQTKLDKNIALDKNAAGQVTKSVSASFTDANVIPVNV